ncbi:12827_t:CDS:2, partial [Gigaspora margarita]
EIEEVEDSFVLEEEEENIATNSFNIPTSITSHFSPNRLLPKATINRLDQKITKIWIMARVPFDVIENPFIIDMFKEFLPAYNPPSRITLSEQLLDEEVAQINYYSSNSHMGEFLANKISTIIEKLSSDKFAAIVIDMASNCNSAWQKIQEIYPHIWNKNQLFFNSSHLSHSLLIKEFKDMKIKGGGLKACIDWHKESITKQEIANLIANEDFFTMCRLVRSVWKPIKEAIYTLETNEATLTN